MPGKRALLVLFVIFGIRFFCGAADFAADRALLLKGVQELPVTGVPGGLSVIGPNAFAVIAGKEGKPLSAVVAATSWERGHIVVFGHNGYLGNSDQRDIGKLLINAVTWCGAGAQPKIKVGVRDNAGLVRFLQSSGFTANDLQGDKWAESLQGVNVVCIDAHHLRGNSEVQKLSAFIKAGGGLVTAATGWGWASVNAGKNLSLDFAGNQLLLPAGLIVNNATPDRTTSHGYSISTSDLALLNASAALDLLIAQRTNKTPVDAQQSLQATATLSLALRALPPSDTSLLPRVTALQKEAGTTEFPRPNRPLKSDQGLGRLLVIQQVEQLKRIAPQQIQAHPAADAFPGSVPKDAPTESQNLTLDSHRPGWHSTGLYAAPGALLKIELPKDQPAKGLRVRVGCHTDELWHLEQWKRIPEITRVEKIGGTETFIANPFGGLVYIEVPDRYEATSLQVTIHGAVAAPYYVLGKTTLEEWKHLRTAPAPWAELECSRVILSVPSEKIRQLENPEALMKLWDAIVLAEDELAGTVDQRKRPERIVPDVEISAGYMHSGYPIMTHLDGSVDTSITLEQLQHGSWGHFHELGHNHQSGDWTFAGTGEVTCNIFSFYVMETVCGRPPGEGHDAMKPAAVRTRLEKYLRNGASFERWQEDPFLALIMYYQLRVGFGWDAYKKLFAEYRNLPKEQRPKNDDEKRDQWLIRFSKTVQRNLGPFFQAWGIPTSESARKSVAELPAWMPEDWPKL